MQCLSLPQSSTSEDFTLVVKMIPQFEYQGVLSGIGIVTVPQFGGIVMLII